MDYTKAQSKALRERVVMEVVKIGYQEIDGAIKYAKELVSFIEGGTISKPIKEPPVWQPVKIVDGKFFSLKKKRGVKLGTIRGPYKKRRKKK